jgi:hypothetical protein
VPDVPVASLPGVSSTIVGSLDAHGPSGFTPTYPALRATYAYLTDFARAHPGDKTILVLSTDGDPTTCDAKNTNNVNAIATQLVAPALAGTPSIPTFVIGVGSSLTSLNQIAVAGGTRSAFIIDTSGAEAGARYLDAMTAISHSTVLDCEYPIPSLADGGAPNLSNAEIDVTPSGGLPHSILRRVANKAACTQQGGGWYVDDTALPARIMLCDSTCVAIGPAPVTSIELLLGCGR